jgi:malonyl-CoA O-methyltransferase
MSVPEFRLDKRALARAFDRAAPAYEAAAALQAEVRNELLQRVQLFQLTPAVVLDLGAGTGRAAAALRRRYPKALTLALDLALGMLRAAPRSWPWRRFERVCADAAALPLAAGSVDLIYSNLMLQWSDHLGAVFAELKRVLRPGGLLLFSTLGPSTLHELRAAWAEADGAEHVSHFAGLHALGSGLMQAGLSEPVMDVEEHRRYYPDARALMAELKQIGATNALATRARALTGRARWQRMLDAYERQREPRGVPATFEVIYGTAFGDAARTRGEVAIPLAAVRRR